MKLTLLPLLIFFTIASFAGEKLMITGSSTIAPVVSDIAKNYENEHKEVRIDVQTGGSSRGIADARKEISQIGMVSRALKSEENDLHHFVIAKDGLAIITHKSNPLNELSQDQIRDIYSGKVTNWKSLGWKDKKIVVVNKAEGRSTLELFLQFFNLTNSNIKASIVIGDNEQGIKTVSTNPNAIAYVSIGAAEYNAHSGTPIKLLNYKGVKASVENVENGSYPLMRELNLVTKSKPAGSTQNFIEYITSGQANSIIKEHYFVPVSKIN